MKRVIKMSLLLALMLFAFSSYSNVSDSVVIRTRVNSDILTIEKVKNGSLLLVRDNHGVVLYRESINDSATTSKSFDLSDLPNDTYYLEIDNSNQIRVIPLVLSNQGIEYISSDEKAISKPNVRVEGKMVHISQYSDDEQDLQVTIYYEGHDVAYRESKRKIKNFNRSYDFAGSIDGEYTIVLNTAGRSYNNKVVIAD